MRIRTEEEKKAYVKPPAGVIVEISGDRKVTALMVSPARVTNAMQSIGRALGIADILTGMSDNEDESTVTGRVASTDDKLSHVRATTLGYYAVLGMTLDDSEIMLETAEPEDVDDSEDADSDDDRGSASDKAILRYALAIQKECESRAGRSLLGWGDIQAITSKAGSLVSSADAQKKS